MLSYCTKLNLNSVHITDATMSSLPLMEGMFNPHALKGNIFSFVLLVNMPNNISLLATNTYHDTIVNVQNVNVAFILKRISSFTQ